MESHDDAKLKAMLREWQVPGAPLSLEARIGAARVPWWRRALTYSVPVPAPVAIALALWALYGLWRIEIRPVSLSCPTPVVATSDRCGSAGTTC